MQVIKTVDITKEIVKRTGFQKSDVTMVVDEVFPIILEALTKGDDVMIKKFGRFTLLRKTPRVCTDARNGKKTMSNYKAVIKFKQSEMIGNQLAILTNPEYDWGDIEE